MSREKQAIHTTSESGQQHQHESSVVQLTDKKNTDNKSSAHHISDANQEVTVQPNADTVSEKQNPHNKNKLNESTNSAGSANEQNATSETEVSISADQNGNSEPESKSGTASKIKVIAGAISILLLFGGVSGGAYYLLNSQNAVSFLNFNASPKKPTVSEDPLLNLQLQVNQLTTELATYKGLDNKVAQWEQKYEMMNDKLDTLRKDLNREVDSFYERSKQREEQITKLRVEVNDMLNEQTFSKAELQRYEKKLAQLESQQITDTEQLQQKLKAFQKLASDESSKKLSNEESNRGVVSGTPPANKASSTTSRNEVKTTTSLGYLYLEQIVSFGNQNIAQFTDGISGATQIVEGDIIGGYRIVKIANNHVIAQSATGETIRVVTRGEA